MPKSAMTESAVRYGAVTEGEFLERPNRFLARVRAREGEIHCHEKNTGRLQEHQVSGARVVLEKSENPRRRTAYSLIGVWFGDTLVNIDSQAPNGAAFSWAAAGADGLFGKVVSVRREKKYGNSRFDLYLETEEEEKGIFLEVKGVTLERGGLACFPDAPTERGEKHVRELIACREDGYGAAFLFVVQRKGLTGVIPNDETQPSFGEALREASSRGVRILAYDCRVTKDGMALDHPLPVYLDPGKSAG